MTKTKKNEIIDSIMALLIELTETETVSTEKTQPVEMLTIKECTEAVHGLSEHTVRQLVLQNKVKYIRTGQGDSPQCGEMSQSDRGDGRPLGERGKILVNKEDLLRLFEAR